MSSIESGGPGFIEISPLVNGGVWLPYFDEESPLTTATPTVVGTANTQGECEFTASYSITIGHVTYWIQTPVAGSLIGVAIYSGDGLTKLTSSDGASGAVGAVAVRLALSSTLTLMRGTKYWLGWTVTDATTLTLSNVLIAANYRDIINKGSIRNGVSNVATAGGITNANIGVPTSLQLRIPLFFFDQ